MKIREGLIPILLLIGFVVTMAMAPPTFPGAEVKDNTYTALATKRAKDILEKVGLSHRLNHRIGELSGGEQQRVAVARALIMNPKLILADEPTGNLDKKTGEGIVELLLSLNEEKGLAMVIATHDITLARKMSRKMEIVEGCLQDT